MCKQLFFATQAAIYRSVRAPPAPKPQKQSQKGSLKGPQISPRKHPKKSKNTLFGSWGYFWTSIIFGDLSADPPKDPFETFFLAISGPEAPETPVNGGSGRNSCSLVEDREVVKCAVEQDWNALLKAAQQLQEDQETSLSVCKSTLDVA